MPVLPVVRVVLVGSAVPEMVRKGHIPRTMHKTKTDISKIIQEHFLKKYAISHIWCAADILVDVDQFPEAYDLHLETQLQNRNYGIWAGRDLRSLSVVEQECFMNPEYSPPSGESILAFHTRLKKWLDRLSEKVKNQETVLVVATPSVIRALSSCILADGIENSFYLLNKLDVYPESWSVFSGRGGSWRILTLSAPI